MVTKGQIRYWQAKLPDTHNLYRMTENYWWVAGFCGYVVGEGDSPREAVENYFETRDRGLAYGEKAKKE